MSDFEGRPWSQLEDVDGCWVPNLCQVKGYTRIYYEGKSHRTHRLTFSLVNGEIPEGYDLDHLCRNRACANPHHLEIVTRAENARRGIGGTWKRGITHCKNGHEFNQQNTTLKSNGPLDKPRRRCRICFNAYMRKLSSAKRGAKSDAQR